ncbi:MAG: hypothetical protein IJM38_09275 [Ruminococcus sp.]|nr:hypothetical protein [Ruminococcus sp.]
MEDMEVLEVEQTTAAEAQEPTTQKAEQETTQEQTQDQTEQEPEQEQTTQETSLISNMPDMSDNAIHEMFYAIGVNLDYVPQTEGEMFTLGAQVVCALFFIWLFFRTLFQFVRELGKGM